MNARQLEQWINEKRRFVYVIVGHSLRRLELCPNGTTRDEGHGDYERRWRVVDTGRGKKSALVFSTQDGQDTMRLRPYGVASALRRGSCTGIRGRWLIPGWPSVLLKPSVPDPAPPLVWRTAETGECLMTGCDRRQEWMLPIWYRHVRLHTHRPVVFGDFGLSPKARLWCRKRGRVIVIPPGIVDHVDYAKPLGILQSGYQRTLWMDCDCVLRADLDALFARKNEIVLALDCPGTEGGTSVQAGVVLIQHGSGIVHQWAEACRRGYLLPMQQLVARVFDQSILDSLCTLNPDRVTLVDRTWNWIVAWGGLNPRAKLWHFAGGAKTLLRRFKQATHFTSTAHSPIIFRSDNVAPSRRAFKN